MKKFMRYLLEPVMFFSLRKAARQQKLNALRDRLEEIVPDISEQYSAFRIDSDYLRLKVRNMHAFQVSLLADILKNKEGFLIADIGDSSGTHLQYINAIYGKDREIRTLSINLDQKAIEKIRQKGLDALNMRGEDLCNNNIRPDIVLCFETLEHLTDPLRFLYDLSVKMDVCFMVITVPYLSKSRVGLHHIRNTLQTTEVCAENTHIFELCPDDWRLLFQHSGWGVVREKIYWQYPQKSIFYFTKYLWRKLDFEGFYGVVLKKNNFWSSKYRDW